MYFLCIKVNSLPYCINLVNFPTHQSNHSIHNISIHHIMAFLTYLCFILPTLLFLQIRLDKQFYWRWPCDEFGISLHNRLGERFTRPSMICTESIVHSSMFNILSMVVVV